MNILRIIGSVDSREGGPVEGLRQSALTMKNWGHQTEVLSLDHPASEWVSSFPFPVHAVGPGITRYRYTNRLRKWISAEAHKFDAAVIHGLWNHSSIGGWQGLRKSKLPYVMFTHGMLDPWFKNSYPAKHLAKQLLWTFQGRALRDASEVLFTSEEECSRARGVFIGHRYREKVVAYGASAAPTLKSSQLAAFQALLPQIVDRPYILYLSRIHKKKGCDLLLKAFVEFSKANPETHLVIAGPDEEGLSEGLLTYAAVHGLRDRVHFPGMLEGEAKCGAFRGAEVFILPSHQENFGIVVAEALSWSKPVLVTDKVNIWREVASSGAGLVESDTFDGILKLLLQWGALPEASREDMAQSAKECFAKNFTIDRAAEDLYLALARAIQNPKLL